MRQIALVCVVVMFVSLTSTVLADTFGTGSNQFSIDFVTISGATNPSSGIPAGQNGFLFTGVNNNYRMGKYEITNDQWNKFQAVYGTVTGNPSIAYDQGPRFTGMNVPFNEASWYEAAQFVNWLNTSTGHHAAYKFTGTQGTSDYTFASWSSQEAYGGTNLYRHKDAIYFLPTENEWVKAAYWNGTNLQTYATKAGESVTQGDGTSGIGWNYISDAPWNVGSGSEEINGTHDMMGNVLEWMESPYSDPSYGIDSYRALRGGAYFPDDVGDRLASSYRVYAPPYHEGDHHGIGFRIASVPEPATLSLLFLGGFAVMRRRQAA